MFPYQITPKSRDCVFVLHLAEQESTVRWAARDAIVKASREFEIDGTPSTLLTLEMLATNGYNRFVRLRLNYFISTNTFL